MARRRDRRCGLAPYIPRPRAGCGAQILELGADGIVPRRHDDLDALRLKRDFLAAPARYLRAALAELDSD